MPWADFWELLDARVDYELTKNGHTRPKEYTPEEAAALRERGREMARKQGWL